MIDWKTVEILMADDSPMDQLMTREAFRASRLRNRLHVVDDGERAMEFLRKEGEFANVPTPDLILLDLNMPRMGGHEVLAELKQSREWKHIPVVILSSSKADADVMKSYAGHANCYVAKPMDYDKFAEAIHRIEDFWFATASLPPNSL